MDNKEKLADILSLLLNEDVGTDSNVSMQNCENWDSLKHIEIITTIEEEFKISFPVEKIPQLTSFKLLSVAMDELV